MSVAISGNLAFVDESDFMKSWERDNPGSYQWFRKEMIQWVPPDKTPSDLAPWYEVYDEVLPFFGGRMVLEWQTDGWRVASAVSFRRESPSGTIGKPVDVHDEMVRALLSKGLPVKG